MNNNARRIIHIFVVFHFGSLDLVYHIIRLLFDSV